MSKPQGFTLIELLLVVVIIGIVAALVLPKFGDVKQKAYVAAMKSDLRNLATAQEIYADNNSGSYAAVATTIPGFSLSDGVSIAISGVTADGYTAAATHSKTSKTCNLAIGLTATNKVSCSGDAVAVAAVVDSAPTGTVSLGIPVNSFQDCSAPGTNTMHASCTFAILVSSMYDAQGDLDVNGRPATYVYSGITPSNTFEQWTNSPTDIENDVRYSSPGTGTISVTLHDTAGHTRVITIPITIVP